MTDEEKKELHAMLPSIPKKFEEWVEKQFDWRRTQFYTRKDGKVIIECCHCGKKTVVDAENFDAEKVHMRCPHCKQVGSFASKKNRKNSIGKDIDVWYGQKLKNGGYVLRFFRPTLMAVPDKEQPYEVFSLTERMRYWFPVGMKKKLIKEFYHPWGWDAGTWNGTYCFSTMGLSDNRPSHGFVYPDTYKNMKGTVMEYSLSEEIGHDSRFCYYLTIGDWQQAYIENKWFEALYKMGLKQIIHEKIYYGLHGMRLNGRAKKPWDYLGIEKRRLKDLIATPDIEKTGALRIYRLERKFGNLEGLTNTLISYHLSESSLSYIRNHTTFRKFVNYIEKQNRNGAVGEWLDYMRMKEELGYDMTDSIIIFPKNLKDAHNKAVIERNQVEADKRKKEAEERFKAIAVRFKGADSVYHYESGAFLIRPAKNASEIVEEGRMLHHCVGGDDYLEKHAKKKTIILFLRTVKEPDTPFITVEVKPNGEIEQWYGIHDSKPEEKKIDRWLGKYVKALDPEQLRREAKRKIKTAS